MMAVFTAELPAVLTVNMSGYGDLAWQNACLSWRACFNANLPLPCFSSRADNTMATY